MGLDVANDLFGNFHVNWAGTQWFRSWCHENGHPNPFVGWITRDNSADKCGLCPKRLHDGLARAWCKALEESKPEIAELGRSLLAQPPQDLHAYLCPYNADKPDCLVRRGMEQARRCRLACDSAERDRARGHSVGV